MEAESELVCAGVWRDGSSGGWVGLDKARLGPQRSRRGGAEPRAYMQI